MQRLRPHVPCEGECAFTAASTASMTLRSQQKGNRHKRRRKMLTTCIPGCTFGGQMHATSMIAFAAAPATCRQPAAKSRSSITVPVLEGLMHTRWGQSGSLECSPTGTFSVRRHSTQAHACGSPLRPRWRPARLRSAPRPSLRRRRRRRRRVSRWKEKPVDGKKGPKLEAQLGRRAATKTTHCATWGSLPAPWALLLHPAALRPV